MPARTNAFQNLVLVLQRQLAPGAVVTESKLVVDTRNATKGIDSPKIVRC